MELLLVEDDAMFGKAIQRGLLEAGHHCEWVRSGEKGFDLARSRRFDVIVLDLMLPGMNGMSVLKALRDTGHRTPILILTALGTVDERVAGLNGGADDYLVKPFAFPELIARLDAIGRRTQARPPSVNSVGELELNMTNRRVLRRGKELELTPTEFMLLEYLMRFAGQVVTRKMLCEHLWESNWEGATNVIEVHINRLRGKIDKGFDRPLIQTVRGRGYSLSGE